MVSNQWCPIASMPQAVTNCSVTACAGKIFSIGCIVNTEQIILQSYTPETGKLLVFYFHSSVAEKHQQL